MGLMAGYGVQLWPILQDVHQLRATYGQRAGTFLSNAGVLQVFGVNDHDSARLVSDLLGQETVVFQTMSRALDAEKTGITYGEQHTARPLLTPDEVRNLPQNLELLFLAGQRPIVAGKLAYYADPEFRGCSTGMKDETMTDTDAPEWPDPADKAYAVEQAKRLRNQVAEGGLRFEAYLPPSLALWLLDLIEQGKFLDPSEAVFVILGEHKELEPHADLRRELLKRSIQAAADDPRPGISGKEMKARLREKFKTPARAGQMGKAVPALTHRGFSLCGPPGRSPLPPLGTTLAPAGPLYQIGP